MGYLTIPELQQQYVIPGILNSQVADYPRIQQLIDYCTGLIDSYVGFKFVPKLGYTFFMDGDGSKKLALPYPIINLTSITALVESYPFNRLVNGNPYVYDLNNIKIVGTRNNQILNLVERFGEGRDNLEIVGDFGWATVPADVINCLVILCNGNYDYLGDGEKLEFSMGPFKTEKIANYEYMLKDKPDENSTGNIQVDTILDQYRRIDEFSIGVV